MGFDSKKFTRTQFIPREEAVSVSDMKDFFNTDIPEFIDTEEKEKNPKWNSPEFVVRGVTGIEMARANEAMERNKNIATILEGLVANNSRKKIDSIKALIGIDAKVPNDIAKRISLFTIGSVDPKIDEQTAVKICTVFPVEFFDITNRIIVITGQGHVPGKPKASGVTQQSKQP